VTQTPPRTKEEAARQVNYSIRLHALHKRLYDRIRVVLAIVQLLASSAVVVEAIANKPWAVTSFGVIVATLGFLDIAYDFAEHAANHGVWRREFSELAARMGGLTLEELDSELARIEGDAEVDFESLRTIAWNDTLRTFGVEGAMRPESRTQKFVRFMA
jgi:hypothetical protein